MSGPCLPPSLAWGVGGAEIHTGYRTGPKPPPRVWVLRAECWVLSAQSSPWPIINWSGPRRKRRLSSGRWAGFHRMRASSRHTGGSWPNPENQTLCPLRLCERHVFSKPDGRCRAYDKASSSCVDGAGVHRGGGLRAAPRTSSAGLEQDSG